jgi:hypothetical protein
MKRSTPAVVAITLLLGALGGVLVATPRAQQSRVPPPIAERTAGRYQIVFSPHGRGDVSAQELRAAHQVSQELSNSFSGMLCTRLVEVSHATTMKVAATEWVEGFVQGIALTLAAVQNDVAAKVFATLEDPDERLALIMIVATHTRIEGGQAPLIKRASPATRFSQLLDACQQHTTDSVQNVAASLIPTWLSVPQKSKHP